jgi:hypothetical protein
VPYLSSEAVGLNFMRFPLKRSSLSRSLLPRMHSLASRSLLTGVRLKFPILEQGSDIQPAFSVRLVSLKRGLDNGSSGLMDALPCPSTLVPMKPATIPQLT